MRTATRPKPVPVTDATFAFKVLRAKRPVLVEFWAGWCRACAALAPVLDELAEQYAGRLDIVKVDVERNPAMTARYGVKSVPTLVLFLDGEEQNRVVDVYRKPAIVEEIQHFLEEEPS